MSYCGMDAVAVNEWWERFGSDPDSTLTHEEVLCYVWDYDWQYDIMADFLGVNEKNLDHMAVDELWESRIPDRFKAGMTMRWILKHKADHYKAWKESGGYGPEDAFER